MLQTTIKGSFKELKVLPPWQCVILKEKQMEWVNSAFPQVKNEANLFWQIKKGRGCESQICSRNINFADNTFKSTNGPRAKATFLLCQQTAFSLLRLASITTIYEKPSDGSDQSGVSFEPQVHGKSQQSI